MTKTPMTAADHIAELVRPFTVTEHVRQPVHNADTGRWVTTNRVHRVPQTALLAQIEETVTTASSAGEVFHAAYGSKPAGRIDCLAFLERIKRQSRKLATKLGAPDLPWVTYQAATLAPVPTTDPDRRKPWIVTRQPVATYPRLNAIAGAIGDRPHPQVKSWWITARILTQHDGPPFSPNIPCPEETCDRWGTIRARLDPSMAVCVECHTTWSDDEGTFGRLAIWAEWASEHLRGPRHWRDEPEINGYDDVYGYPPELGYDDHYGYRVICPECEPERTAMAAREADRIAVHRANRHPKRKAS